MRCTNCGAELKENAKFCNQCGTPVVNNQEISSENNTANDIVPEKETKKIDVDQIKKNWNDRYTILVLIAVMVIAGAAGLIVKSVSKNRSEEASNNIEENIDLEENNSADDDEIYADDIAEDEQPEQGTVKQEVVEEDVDEKEEPKYDVTEGGIHEYGFFIDDCTWSEAFTKAQEIGGHLVRINSAEEYVYILDKIYELGYDKIQFRIGGRRDLDSGEYYWVDNNNAAYGEILNDPEYWASEVWMQGEPSYADGEIVENCLDIYYYEQEGRWVWNDVPDDIISVVPYFSGKIGYIVEYEN